MTMFAAVSSVVVAAAVLGQGQGPGKGPWELASPESMGLNTSLLGGAAVEIRSKARNRNCFLVAKEGKIVYEQYYGSSDEKTKSAAYSTTKSLCSSLMGRSIELGWGSVADGVDKARDPLNCNKEATMQNVLTMTGQSNDLNNPTFNYDALGTNCYDTIQGYILRNNPEGLSTEEWMLKHFWNQVGFEHSEWRAGIWLQCGTSSQMTCRDLARHAQLWLNEGFWPGEGQLLNKEYVKKGTTWVYPDQGDPYGYGVRLRPYDPVDNKVAYFGGIFLNCAFFSKEHQAVVVSMGSDLLSSCQGEVWEEARYAVVSKDHPLWTEANPEFQAAVDRLAAAGLERKAEA